ncbi:MAG: hypothetical protein SFX72_19640 [Isosphaeraceae bacterium]|nr:hypothetical protein [Isosphaeraceae bacterium]
MPTSFTPNLGLRKPAQSDLDWGVPLNENADTLDRLAPLQSLFVTSHDSIDLAVKVAPGRYRRLDGTFAWFAGAPLLAIPPSSSQSIWLTDSGELSFGLAYPNTPHIPLAVVTADSTGLTSLQDDRIGLGVGGEGSEYLLRQGGVISGSVVVESTSGTRILELNPSESTLGFFGVTPAVQFPAIPNLVGNGLGAPSGSVLAAGPTHDAAILDANFATLTARLNAVLELLRAYGLLMS